MYRQRRRRPVFRTNVFPVPPPRSHFPRPTCQVSAAAQRPGEFLHRWWGEGGTLDRGRALARTPLADRPGRLPTVSDAPGAGARRLCRRRRCTDRPPGPALRLSRGFSASARLSAARPPLRQSNGYRYTPLVLPSPPLSSSLPLPLLPPSMSPGPIKMVRKNFVRKLCCLSLKIPCGSSDSADCAGALINFFTPFHVSSSFKSIGAFNCRVGGKLCGYPEYI